MINYYPNYVPCNYINKNNNLYKINLQLIIKML